MLQLLVPFRFGSTAVTTPRPALLSVLVLRQWRRQWCQWLLLLLRALLSVE